MTKQDEQLLMEQLSDPTKQRKAFEQVVREYGEQLYWQIRRLVLIHEDADDVLQNVFIKAWSHLDDFHQESRLSTWLYRIAVNESLDFLRKQKNSTMIHTDDVESGVANMLVADNYFDGDETQALRDYDEMKYSEMSRILKTSEGSLKASYHIAVKKISEFFNHRD